MKAHINYNTHERPWWAPLRTFNATQNALVSGPIDKTMNELEYTFNMIYPVDVFTPLVYSVQHKLNTD